MTPLAQLVAEHEASCRACRAGWHCETRGALMMGLALNALNAVWPGR